MKKTAFLFNLLIALLLVLCLVGPAAMPAVTQVVKAQPQLVQLAAEAPQQQVSLIIQAAGSADPARALVQAMGGVVETELAIINAFSARMTAAAAIELASNPAVRWVSLDAPMQGTACEQCIDTSKLVSTYVSTINATSVWNTSPYLQGKAVGVAVVDSGINPSGDLYTNMGVNRLVANVRFNTDSNQTPSDGYGHGTHVASIIGGDGSDNGGKYIGVAPMVNLINVKVSNDDGSMRLCDVVAGLEWILNNKAAYNIRVVNLSLNSTLAESYRTNPLDAAVEVLWFNKIVVVVSSGNSGSGVIYPPANDPFVITVGATDDKATAALSDDVVASFSAYGTTENGFAKPELVAPGTNIVAQIVNINMGLAAEHPSNKLLNGYFRMSGTSMAAPMVSGAVAILLQDEPTLTPDQVKYRLMATANKSWSGYSAARAGAGYLDVAAAVAGKTTTSANKGTLPSTLLGTGTTPINTNVAWNSVAWNSVAWNSVAWNSVAWNSVAWNSVAWNSDYWGQ